MIENFNPNDFLFSLANLNIAYYKIQNFKIHETKIKRFISKKNAIAKV